MKECPHTHSDMQPHCSNLEQKLMTELLPLGQHSPLYIWSNRSVYGYVDFDYDHSKALLYIWLFCFVLMFVVDTCIMSTKNNLIDSIPELAEGRSDTCRQRLNCCWPLKGKKGHSCSLMVKVGHCSSVEKSVGTVVRKTSGWETQLWKRHKNVCNVLFGH